MSDGEAIEGVVFDTTVLSNYAASDSVEFLISTFSSPMTTRAVREELEQGVDSGRPYLERALPYLINSFDPKTGKTIESDEKITVNKTRVRETSDDIQELDYGEKHALAYARYQGHALATDDMEARKVAENYDLPYTGSLGILIRGIERDEIPLEKAEAWHTVWVRDNNYYSPVSEVADLL